jgi:hypothetical protein
MFGFHAYDKMLKHFQTYFHKKIKKKKKHLSHVLKIQKNMNIITSL